MRPGMLSAAGPRPSSGTGSGRRSRGSWVRRVGVHHPAARPTPGRVPLARTGGSRRAPRTLASARRGVARVGCRSSASASTTISPRSRREDADERADGRQVERAVRARRGRRRPRSRRRGRRPGPCRARAIDAADRDADDLVPVTSPRASSPTGGRPTRGRCRAGASAASRGRDLRNRSAPARPVGDGLGRGDRQRRVGALAMETAPGANRCLRAVGQDLDPDGAAQAVDAPHEARPRAVRSPCDVAPSSATVGPSLRRSRAGPARRRGRP